MNSETYPLCRKDNIVIQELEEEILVYDLSVNKALCLNQTSASVWDECDGTKSVAEIARILSNKHKTPVSEEIVWIAVDKLKSENLLANSEIINVNFNGLSRRQALKKAGLTSLLVLPVILSLVVPAAAQAQTLVCDCNALPLLDARLESCPCTSNNDCCGNCNIGTMLCSGPLPDTLPPGASCCPPNFMT